MGTFLPLGGSLRASMASVGGGKKSIGDALLASQKLRVELCDLYSGCPSHEPRSSPLAWTLKTVIRVARFQVVALFHNPNNATKAQRSGDEMCKIVLRRNGSATTIRAYRQDATPSEVRIGNRTQGGDSRNRSTRDARAIVEYKRGRNGRGICHRMGRRHICPLTFLGTNYKYSNSHPGCCAQPYWLSLRVRICRTKSRTT